LAGAVVLQLGDTATYLFGATSRAGREAKAGYALHWWIARWLRGAGVRWYDLGGEAGEPGLRQFKKGLVGKNGCAHKLLGEYEAGSRPLSALAARLAFGLRDSQLLTLIRYHGLKLAGSLRAWLCISFVAA
jgi:lipid II:glycine glycyltransferase (peptidoglycan interpeptide bridge formation enzyme)